MRKTKTEGMVQRPFPSLWNVIDQNGAENKEERLFYHLEPTKRALPSSHEHLIRGASQVYIIAWVVSNKNVKFRRIFIVRGRENTGSLVPVPA